MSILTNYVDFRAAFTDTGVIGSDGHPHFQAATNFYRPFVSYDTWDPVAGITIDIAGLDDASPYVDEWHHYLSDPGSANGSPIWEIVRADPSAFVSRSARFTLRLTALGQSLYVVGDSDIMSAMLHQVHLYSIPIGSDTHWSDLHRCAFAAASFPPSVSIIIT